MRHVVVGAEDVEVAVPHRSSMKSTICSAVQAPFGLSLGGAPARPVKVEPGIRRCAVTLQPAMVAQGMREASVTTFTPALLTL